MRLIVIGSLDHQVAAATRIALARGAKVTHAASPEVALENLRNGHGADLAMIDVRLDIKWFIEALRAEHISLSVCAYGIGQDQAAAVAAIRAGAKEYIPLPPDPELIAAVLEAATNDNQPLIYRDQVMADVIKLADQVAGSEASILITGESGTGKEVMARYLHSKSLRAEKPFISVNCAAIPDNLLESELFGHEKGAFTGAVARRVGKFEEAHGGTLLLDEITEMEVRLQAKLLRAIQERVIDRVGGGKPVRVDIRVIATSNRDLVEAVRAGTFREDLLFRLNVVNLRLPPLRARPNDILALAEHFARKYADQNNVPVRSLAIATKQLLQRNPWRGNVRELENTMHRAVLLSQGEEIGPDAILLPDGSRPDAAPATAVPLGPSDPAVARLTGAIGLVGRTVAEVERDLILDTLNHCLGNRTHAATILGISIRTLRNKLKQYSDEGVLVPAPGGEARAQVA